MSLSKSLPAVCVMALSLLLLLYVGRGETQRVYEKFQLVKLATQGKLVKELMEDFLREGLPLHPFVTSFLDDSLQLARRFIGIENAAHAIAVRDINGRVVFDKGAALDANGQPRGEPVTLRGVPFDVRRGDRHYNMTLPLHDRFKLRGSLTVVMPTEIVTRAIRQGFAPVWHLAAGLFIAFTILTLVIEYRQPRRRDTYLAYAYGTTFTIAAIAIILTLLQTYQEGAQARVRALGDSLGQRMHAILDAGSDFRHVAGLDDILRDFHQHDPDIDAALLVVDGQVFSPSDAARFGRPWQSNPQDVEYQVPINANAFVVVSLPRRIVRDSVLRNAKDFTALFVACGFISFLFLTVATSLRDLPILWATTKKAQAEPEDQSVQSPRNPDSVQTLWLNLMQAIWFLLVFVEGLNASFLPQYFQGLVANPWQAMLLFTAFFAAFACALIPAGQIAETYEVKYLLLVGITCAVMGLTAMRLTSTVPVLFLARLLSGLGHGLSFIAVQSYILLVTSAAKRTQGAGRQVFAQNSGVISGAAIGALLVVYLQPADIFLLGCVLALLTGIFVGVWVPPAGLHADTEHQTPRSQPLTRFLQQSKILFQDFEFIRTFLFVGSASKVVYNGVVFFAIPLVMSRQGYAQEDIGQGLMLFASAVLLANFYVARVVDKFGSVHRFLACGVVSSGLGAVFIGLTAWDSVPDHILPFNQIALFCGLAILGLANGFIAAPVVTYILDTQSAAKLGRQSTLAVYRLLERLGHVFGPLIVGQILLFYHHRASAIGLMGLGIIACGIIFIAFHQRPRQTEQSIFSPRIAPRPPDAGVSSHAGRWEAADDLRHRNDFN